MYYFKYILQNSALGYMQGGSKLLVVVVVVFNDYFHFQSIICVQEKQDCTFEATSLVNIKISLKQYFI